MSAERWLSIVSRTLKDNSPSILSGVAITGVIGTAVLAVRATPRAAQRIAYNEVGTEGITATEKIKLTWRFYIPAGLTGVATIACIVGANSIGARRGAAIAGAYTIVDTAFREYKDKVLEELGPDKERKISDDVMQGRIERNPVSATQILVTGVGDQLCFDALTGRYFKSDIEAIRKAQNDVNSSVIRDMYAPHNEFYQLLGLEQTLVGDELGWNLDNLMDLRFSSHLSDCGQPCLAINYASLPRKDYGKF